MTNERTDATAVSTTAPRGAAETERNLPAVSGTTALATTEPDATPPRWRQPVSVAFLPLAVATLLLIAFAMALWTFLATTG